jgi:hypothetical protein
MRNIKFYKSTKGEFMKKINYILLAVIVSTMIMGWSGCSNETPSHTVYLSHEYLLDDNYKDAYELVSSEVKKRSGFKNYKDYEKLILTAKSWGPFPEKIEVIEETVAGDRAEVRYLATMPNGKKSQITAKLVKESGRWKAGL